jgi:hypothetical protein
VVSVERERRWVEVQGGGSEKGRQRNGGQLRRFFSCNCSYASSRPAVYLESCNAFFP